MCMRCKESYLNFIFLHSLLALIWVRIQLNPKEKHSRTYIGTKEMKDPILEGTRRLCTGCMLHIGAQGHLLHRFILANWS